ncbi:MAG: hypothetical protein HQL18_01685, partial [Candidatus Omnitrophica bacterium]|nr:hypothetical protein [Candidatus Omnitrophota bacterium]
MKKNNLLIIFCLATSFAYGEDLPSWRNLSLSLGQENVSNAWIGNGEQEKLYFATRQGLFASDLPAHGLTRLPSRILSGPVNDLFIKEDEKGLFAATDSGLQFSKDLGETWTNIFAGEKALTVLEDAGRLLVGTDKGLYLRKSEKETVFRLPGTVGRMTIRALRSHPKGTII